MACGHVSETVHIMTERKGGRDGGRERERVSIGGREEDQTPKDPSQLGPT